MLTTTHAMFLAGALLALAGCSQSNTTAQNNTGVAGLLANSMPGGAVSQNGQVVSSAQNAANTPNVQNILTAVNTANGASTPPPSNVTNALTPSNILAAVAAVQAANAAKQQTYPTNPNAFGPGPFFTGPDAFGGGNVMQGPGAFKVIQPGN